jgi:PAS domain S-box-containing protein
MTVLPTAPAHQKGWLPLILIAVLTIAILVVSVISLLSGWQTIFQNLFYFPIILACVYYVRRGFVFSVLLACGYFVLMAIFSNDPVVLQGAIIRVLIFILVAGVITYLSIVRIRAEDALKESEEFNRGLVENMPNLVVVYDHDRKIRYVNPTATTILGYTVEEMVGTDIMTYVAPHQHGEIVAATEERFSSGRGGSLEVKLITKTGQHLTVISKGAPLHFQNQPAVLILLADISDRKRAEEALQESERRLGEIIDFLPDPTFVIDTAGTVIAWNSAIASLLGVEAPGIIGKGNYEHAFRMFGHRRPVLIDLVIHGNEAIVQKHYPGIRKEHGMLMAEFVIPNLHGKRTVLWVIATPLYNAKGEITGAIESMRDITYIHDIEVQLRESRQQLTDIIDFLPDATFAIDTAGTVIAWNRAIEVMMGVPKAGMLGKGNYAYAIPAYGEHRPVLIDLVLHEDLEQEKKYALFTRNGDQLIAEAFAQNINGGKGEHIWMIASPLYDRDGRITGAIESIRIVTDRKRAEVALKEANKKLNLLSSITRHDINNQMTVLMGYLTLLEEKLPDPTLTGYFQKVTTAANRISAMIQFTKTYESIGVHAPAWQDIRTLAESAAMDVAMGPVRLLNDLPAGTEVFADPLIVKVFYNLMDNAVRYGGKITTIRVSVQEANEDHILVCEDDGDGILTGEKEKIFIRGFGKNTGLGLFLSREILDITGITIKETGEPGKGARFEISVPNGAWQQREKNV